jgi:hypothetical protein
VRTFCKRRIAILLALACLASLPAMRAPLLLASLALGHAAGGHSYSLLLAEDASHFDLVVSHGDHDEHEPAREHGAHPSCSESDHVVHLCADPVLQKSERRACSASAPGGLPAASILSAAAPLRLPTRPLTPSLQAADGLRSVVIRC